MRHPSPSPELSRPLLPRRGALAVRLALGFAAAALASCGGGNGTSSNASNAASQAPAPAPAAQPALTITAIAPGTGPVGTAITVTGTGLDAATSATVGNVAAALRVISATQVQVTVPAGAATGRVGVVAGSRAALSSGDFAVAAAPAPAPTPAPAPGTPVVTSVTPSSVIAGGRLTLAGTALDQVASARLAGAPPVPLIIAGQSALQLLLDLPANAASGTLTLVDRAGTARNVAQPITVLPALAVTTFTPATIARGQTLTVNGRGLDRATAVSFGGGASAAVASRSGSTSLAVVVPGSAISGPITVLGGTTEQAASTASLTVLEPIVLTPQSFVAAAAGASVTITGSGLAQVGSVSVGTATASITAQSATALTFTVPAGVVCGAIVIHAPGLPDVNAGSITVGAGCVLRAAAVEFAQVMSQPSGDPYQRLAANKETWVRAFVVAASPSTPAPAVRALGFNAAGQALGAVALAGPATLPVLAAGAAVTTAMRYDDASSYNAQLPLAWVQPGLRVRIEAADAASVAASPAATVESTPLVSAGGGLRIVIVPLVSGANAPTLPGATEVLNELARKMPLPATGITVGFRAPYALSSVTTGVTTSAEWSAALAELERLRDAEAPDSLYFGMVRPMVTSGVAGIGYVNSIGSRSPSLSSLGWDASRSSWRTTMVHELGHNFSRPHAPCGNVAGADPNYPYANGALGATPLFDSLIDDVLAPTGQADIMGYCRGEWFSDYNLNGVMRFLEARPAALQSVIATAAPKPASDAPITLVVISGSIDASGAVLAPLRSQRSPATDARLSAAAVGGSHVLRLVLVDGQVIEHRFDPVEVDHVPGEGHFMLRLADPGPIAGIEVLRGRDLLMSRRASTKPGAAAQAPAAGVSSAGGTGGSTTGNAGTGPWAEVAREGDTLVLRWDAANHAHASLALVVGTTRHVLALDATGGRWIVPAAAWRALATIGGGHFEVGLSDGVGTALLLIPRP